MSKALAYAATSNTSPMAPITISSRATWNREQMNAQAGKLDFILNTVAVPHSLDTYLALLRHGGTMVLVGIPEKPHPSPSVASLIGLRRSLAGSLFGGIKETQEMLDFCAENGVLPRPRLFRCRRSRQPSPEW
jgi:alcohol dehydrogenase (NADP+)